MKGIKRRRLHLAQCIMKRAQHNRSDFNSKMRMRYDLLKSNNGAKHEEVD